MHLFHEILIRRYKYTLCRTQSMLEHIRQRGCFLVSLMPHTPLYITQERTWNLEMIVNKMVMVGIESLWFSIKPLGVDGPSTRKVFHSTLCSVKGELWLIVCVRIDVLPHGKPICTLIQTVEEALCLAVKKKRFPSSDGLADHFLP